MTPCSRGGNSWPDGELWQSPARLWLVSRRTICLETDIISAPAARTIDTGELIDPIVLLSLSYLYRWRTGAEGRTFYIHGVSQQFMTEKGQCANVWKSQSTGGGRLSEKALVLGGTSPGGNLPGGTFVQTRGRQTWDMGLHSLYL